MPLSEPQSLQGEYCKEQMAMGGDARSFCSDPNRRQGEPRDDCHGRFPRSPSKGSGGGAWARRRGFTRGGASAPDSAPDRSHPRRSLSGGGRAGVPPAVGP